MASKEDVLKQTQNGLLYFKHIFTELEIDGNRSKNTLNPYYKDTNRGVSVWQDENGMWYYKDHGEPSFCGDAFQLAAYDFDLDIKDDFPEILRRMAEIDYSIDVKFKRSSSAVEATTRDKRTEARLLRRENDQFKKHELKFFARSGITEDILNEYDVVPFDGFTYPAGYTSRRMNGQIMVAYLMDRAVKTYTTDPKTFRWLGDKPIDYVFGRMQAEGNQHVFLVGGEKDVLTMKALGYGAICLNCETAYLPDNLLSEMEDWDVKLYSFLDNDDTGIKSSKILQQKHGIKPLRMPHSILRKGGKDISDYVYKGLTKDQFDQIVDDFLNGNDPVDDDDDDNNDPSQDGSSSSAESEDDEDESGSCTENLPDDLYENLPPLLAGCCEPFSSQQEKTMVLLTALTMLGAIIKNVSGAYDNDCAGSNLYLFVVAPASSGKGNIKYAKLLGHKVHKYMKDEYVNEELDEGERVTFFIPANSSSSSILRQLANNNGYGILFETEADTLSETLGKEWGNFSDALRKAFHHETISYQRRTGNELIEIENPNLGIVLSGTPNQVRTLIPDPENGLCSRFMFYNFKSKTAWKDVWKASNQKQVKQEFLNMADDVFEFYKRLDALDYDIDFAFTEEQQMMFNDLFEEWQDNALRIAGDGMLASMRRLGVITFKIAMILSAIRLVKSESLPQTIVCSDVDFVIALDIAKCLKAHCISIHENLKVKNQTSKLTHQKQVTYFESLPTKFNRNVSMDVARSLGIKEKTAEGYLKKFQEKGMLTKPDFNVYRKA